MQNSPPTKPPCGPPGRGRGRPRGFDRDAALAGAMRLFWHKGFSATSIAELTEAMGIGSPSLYAAFGSKEALYAEALRHYGERYEALAWGNFAAARTARGAVEALLMDSAAALTGSCGREEPTGCMVTLSAAGSEGHAELGAIVRAARAYGLERVRARLARAVADGEIDPSVDIAALARFVMTVQNGMSLQARDGASRAELEAVAAHAMLVWDARLRG
ncbi:TetR/AcrR family transcriptional regulator [Methylobacterium nonmethylotrophicum]|uniref:TetR/AcrR family transcriptional regulator n=1 Tax=Methylobacterium nonmethylotrophicum TaxID=1141884 RepID=A0A4Z0NVL3_9HYPH|nr:TetR/AcrR family transcriptional regulator [Methylobacterium nonmethylotrophicum]TGE01082.1 TetR/AcrR family transcriptional regulator [Methylobacterium nonmethylotrophicum]